MTRALVPHAGGALRLRSVDDLRSTHEMLSRALGGKRPSGELALCLALGDSCGMTIGESLSQIHIVEGKPTIGAAAQLALLHRAGVKTRWTETSDDRAVLALYLDGPDAAPTTHGYTMADARRAGLAGRGQWAKYPAQMLRARCITDAIRAHCPEVLGGAVYDPEEVGGQPVDVVVVAEPEIVAAPPPASDPTAAAVAWLRRQDLLDAAIEEHGEPDEWDVARVRSWAKWAIEARRAREAAIDGDDTSDTGGAS